MISNLDRLAYMANHIARNFAVKGEAAAARATADHIASFWDPRMKRQAFEMIAQGGGALGPIAAAAIRMLHDSGAPAHQSRATEFSAVDEEGHADAG